MKSGCSSIAAQRSAHQRSDARSFAAHLGSSNSTKAKGGGRGGSLMLMPRMRPNCCERESRRGGRERWSEGDEGGRTFVQITRAGRSALLPLSEKLPCSPSLTQRPQSHMISGHACGRWERDRERQSLAYLVEHVGEIALPDVIRELPDVYDARTPHLCLALFEWDLTEIK